MNKKDNKLVVYQINTGNMVMKKGFYLFPAFEDIAIYPCYVYLICNENYYLLYDTGISNNLKGNLGIFDRFLHFEKTDIYNLEQQLSNLNMDANQINGIIVSHLHFDHCSNNKMFTKTPFYVQRKEYEAMCNDKKNPMYKELMLDKNCFTIMEDDYQFEQYGCTYNLLLTQGHSAGHQILIFENGEYAIFFLGDTCYRYDEKLLPIEGKDSKSYEHVMQSIDFIEKLIAEKEKKKKVCLFFSHDLDPNSNRCYREEISDGICAYQFSKEATE